MLSYPSYLINSHYTEDVRALLLGLVAIIAEPYKDKIKYYEKMLKIRKFMKNKDNGVFDAVIQRARTAKIKDLYSFVGLKKIKNGHVACCPLHNEKTPSFNMRDNVFYCFGCHRKGDSIQFIQDLYNVTFKKALSIITGINVR